MEGMQVGFSRLDITPPLGVCLSGYYERREADGILDILTASALAVRSGTHTAVIFSVDTIGSPQEFMNPLRAYIAQQNGLASPEAVFIACTHTHTGPTLGNHLFETDETYAAYFKRRLCDAAALAIADLHPATLYGARGKAEGISFIRRFMMKHGRVQTNPGLQNPDVVAPVGTPDEQMQLVRIERSGAPEILLVNFQVHPDVVGGCKFSADHPGFVREYVERALPGTRCMYFNGAQGDTNHIDVSRPAGQGNGGYTYAQHMGRTIAGAVLAAYGRTAPLGSEGVSFAQIIHEAPTNKNLDPDAVAQARHMIELHKAGHTDELHLKGMEKTTAIAGAYRLVRQMESPDLWPLPVAGIRLGGMAFLGIPGEPFTDVGRALKDGSPHEMTFVCCCSNGYEGYYPTRNAYEEGGYEASSARYQAGVAEALADTGLAVLKSL